MIKRKYFFSVKVAHNNDTGKYSWFHSIVNYKSWRSNPEFILKAIRQHSIEALSVEMHRSISMGEIEILSVSKV
jgi:hypothetical protein